MLFVSFTISKILFEMFKRIIKPCILVLASTFMQQAIDDTRQKDMKNQVKIVSENYFSAILLACD